MYIFLKQSGNLHGRCVCLIRIKYLPRVSVRCVNLVQNVGDVLCRGCGDRSPPVGSRGKAPVGGLGDEVPQKLKQFWISICIILS